MSDHGYLAYKILGAQTSDTVLLKPTNHVVKSSQPQIASKILDASVLVLPSGKPEHNGGPNFTNLLRGPTLGGQVLQI